MVNKEETIEYLKGYIGRRFSEIRETFTGDEFSPEVTMHFRTEEGKYIVLPVPRAEVFFRNERMKGLLGGYIQMISDSLEAESASEVQDTDLAAVVVVSDAYFSVHDMSHIPEEERKNYESKVPRPSEDPNRQEVIMFACSMKEDSYTRTYPYTRNGTITFAEPKSMERTKAGGRMVNLFPE